MVVVQFVMTASFTMIAPIMPLLLPQLGVHDASRIDLWAGILNAINFLVAAVASPLWGALADRHGRKLMVLRCSLAVCVFTFLMGFARNVWQLLALRGLMGAFSGFSAAAIALVASQTPEDRLGYALGWLASGQLVGALVGPVIGGGLADLTGSYRAPFFLTSALAGIALLLCWRLVPERFTPPAKDSQRPSLRQSLTLLFGTTALLPLFVVLLLAQFGTRTVQPVVTLYVQALVGNSPSLATLGGIAFSMTGVADLIASPFLGKRSDVLGYRRVLLVCLAGSVAASLPQAFAHSYWSFLAGRFALGIFVGGILPTANALVGRLAGRENRGLVYGATASATFLGGFLGPISGGAVAAAFGLRWVFVMTAAVLATSLAWVWLTVPRGVDATLRGSADQGAEHGANHGT